MYYITYDSNENFLGDYLCRQRHYLIHTFFYILDIEKPDYETLSLYDIKTLKLSIKTKYRAKEISKKIARAFVPTYAFIKTLNSAEFKKYMSINQNLRHIPQDAPFPEKYKRAITRIYQHSLRRRCAGTSNVVDGAISLSTGNAS